MVLLQYIYNLIVCVCKQKKIMYVYYWRNVLLNLNKGMIVHFGKGKQTKNELKKYWKR